MLKHELLLNNTLEKNKLEIKNKITILEKERKNKYIIDAYFIVYNLFIYMKYERNKFKDNKLLIKSHNSLEYLEYEMLNNVNIILNKYNYKLFKLNNTVYYLENICIQN